MGTCWRSTATLECESEDLNVASVALCCKGYEERSLKTFHHLLIGYNPIIYQARPSTNLRLPSLTPRIF